MGSYITSALDLKEFFEEVRVVQLASGASSETLSSLAPATAARINSAIAAAEKFMNGKLRAARFTVPVTPVSDELRECAAIMTMHRLAVRKPETRRLFEDDNAEWVEWLDSLVEGANHLGADVTSGSSESLQSTVDTRSTAKRGGVFANGGLDDM